MLRKLIVWPLLVATDGGRVKVRGTSSEAARSGGCDFGGG